MLEVLPAKQAATRGAGTGLPKKYRNFAACPNPCYFIVTTLTVVGVMRLAR